MDENPLTPLILHTPGHAGDAARLRAADGVNELAELVADLLEPSGLIPADRLAALRGEPAEGRSPRR